jgi:hypothetical protein
MKNEPSPRYTSRRKTRTAAKLLVAVNDAIAAVDRVKRLRDQLSRESKHGDTMPPQLRLADVQESGHA